MNHRKVNEWLERFRGGQMSIVDVSVLDGCNVLRFRGSDECTWVTEESALMRLK